MQKESKGLLAKGLYGVGILCLLYFAALSVSLGITYIFNYFWLTCGGACLAAARFQPQIQELPLAVRRIGKALILAGLLVFLTVEAMIFSAAQGSPEADADYVIVLGAKVNGETPSKRLQERIDAARSYVSQYPEAQIIASGGQGADEQVTEAFAIAQTMTRQGVDAEQILLEEKSKSTEQNLVYSQAFIDDRDAKVVIATSDFHVFRAVGIAKKNGYKNVSGLPAPATSHHFLTPNYYVREFFGVVNDFIIKPLRE